MLRNLKSLQAHDWGAANAAPRRRVRSVRWLAGVLALLPLVGSTVDVMAQATNPNRAALVVVHGDGRTVTRCVEFAEAQITGLELAQRSGLDLNLEASGMGATICRLDGEGCTYPQQSCFCQCEGESCLYWAYWRSQEGAWVYANLGASNSVVTPGALEGWVWGAGTVETAKPPPSVTFDAICAAPTATSTATQAATATPIVTASPAAAMTATATWTPSSTATASATPAPTWAPLAAPPTPTATETPSPTSTPTPSATLLPVAPGTTLPPPVIAAFAADRKEIVAGETVILRWQVTNAEAVTLQAAGKTVAIPPAGELVLAPPQNTTYLLAAANIGGGASTALTVVVRPAPPVNRAQATPAQPPAPPVSAVLSSVSPLPSPLTASAPAGLPTATPTTTALPAPTATPTPAPVVLVAFSTPADAMTSMAAGAPPLPTATLLLTVVGAVAMLGVPLAGLALFVLFWTLRRA